jgi:hypothetical protein
MPCAVVVRPPVPRCVTRRAHKLTNRSSLQAEVEELRVAVQRPTSVADGAN